MAVDVSERFPMDFDKLTKGDTISAAQVAEIMDVDPKDPSAMSLASMMLCKRIEKELLARDNPVTVCTVKGDVHICTDEEAETVNQKAMNKTVRAQRYYHKRMMAIDTSHFPKEEQELHDRRLEINGAIIATTAALRKSPKLAAALRKTPKLS